jgi:hypothetical protein
MKAMTAVMLNLQEVTVVLAISSINKFTISRKLPRKNRKK